MKPQNIEIPFGLNISKVDDTFRMELVNAEERIPLDEIYIRHDSIHIPMYIFDATIHARIVDSERIEGVYIKDYAEDYMVPFVATFGDNNRFKTVNNRESTTSFDGKWEVDFASEGKIEKAIGVFKQEGSRITGTFLNPTGDYRYLEGVADGDMMKISCFDGTHAYLFEAKMLDDGTLEGDFWSGKTWHQKWSARRNEEFELPDPYSMTYMKEGYEKFEFTFQNSVGKIVSLNDEKYRDKVIVVQIMGTWCPNCMDETRFYSDWYSRNRHRGVEIVGLAFEQKADIDYARNRVARMKSKLGVDYEVLIAGTRTPESRAEALPMLNEILSFPTSVILDKQHKVRKIHTGFSGPGTGVYYENFVEEFNLFMDKLILE